MLLMKNLNQFKKVLSNLNNNYNNYKIKNKYKTKFL